MLFNIIDHEEEKILKLLLKGFKNKFWKVKPLMVRDTVEYLLQKDKTEAVGKMIKTMFARRENQLNNLKEKSGIRGLFAEAEKKNRAEKKREEKENRKNGKGNKLVRDNFKKKSNIN